MIHPMPYPQQALYTPKHGGGLRYPVSVLATRQMSGRVEYQITSDGQQTTWITAGPDGRRLQFEEGA